MHMSGALGEKSEDVGIKNMEKRNYDMFIGFLVRGQTPSITLFLGCVRMCACVCVCMCVCVFVCVYVDIVFVCGCVNTSDKSFFIESRL